MNPNDETDLCQGIRRDLIHFRWMVARVIVTSLPNYRHQRLSETFKLFFSTIYILHADKYSIFQLLHPIFFDASDRMSFLQLIQDYLEENPKAKNGLRHLDLFFNSGGMTFPRGLGICLIRCINLTKIIYTYKKYRAAHYPSL